MTFRWSTLLVKDMKASLYFYQEALGLELAGREAPYPGLEIAFLETGDTKIELVCSAENNNAMVGDAVSWGFQVASLEEALARMEAHGIPIHIGPIEHPAVRYFFVQDPDGLKIQLKEIL